MSPTNIFDSEVKLTDSMGEQFIYKTMVVLIVSRYSNTIYIVKKEADHYMTYTDHSYEKTVMLSQSDLMDLFSTSMSIMAFYSRVSEKFFNLTEVYLTCFVILESNICTGNISEINFSRYFERCSQTDSTEG